MTLRSKLAAFAAATLLAFPAFAEDAIHVEDVYARSMGGMGASGAVFFMMHNMGTADDRLIGAKADVAAKVELHTHIMDDAGVMKMTQIEGGVPIAAGEMHAFQRGADHVMLMGLTVALKDGDHFPLTLVFETAGEVTVDAVVDNARKPAMGEMDMDMGG